MNGHMAKELRSLARIIEEDPPPGFIAHLERYAGPLIFNAQERYRYSPETAKRDKKGNFLTRAFRVFRSSGRGQQRDLYRWLKRLYVRGQLPDRFRMKWNVGNG